MLSRLKYYKVQPCGAPANPKTRVRMYTKELSSLPIHDSFSEPGQSLSPLVTRTFYFSMIGLLPLTTQCSTVPSTTAALPSSTPYDWTPEHGRCVALPE